MFSYRKEMFSLERKGLTNDGKVYYRKEMFCPDRKVWCTYRISIWEGGWLSGLGKNGKGGGE